MQDTFRKVADDQLIDSGPTKYAAFRNKAKSIVTSGLVSAPSPRDGHLKSKALLHSAVDPDELNASP